MGFFHHDLDTMHASLDVIAEVDADAIIPATTGASRFSARRGGPAQADAS